MFLASVASSLVYAVGSLALGLNLASVGSTTTVTAEICPSSIQAVSLQSSEASPTTASNTTLSGTAQPGARLSVTNNTATIATLIALADGSFQTSAPLAIGSNAFVVQEQVCNLSGNSPTVTVVRDQVPPAAPNISTPAIGSTVSAQPVTVSGSAEPNSSVAISYDGTVVATLTADSSGIFSVTLTVTPGSHTLSATATNSAGSSPPSVPQTFTYTPPAAPSPPAARPAASPVAVGVVPAPPTLVAPTSLVVTSSTFYLTVQAQAGTSVQVYRNNILVATVRMGGQPSTIAIPLQPGRNEFYAIARNSAGTSNRSNTLVLTYSVVAGAAPVIEDPEATSQTAHNHVTLSGTAQSNAQLTVGRNGVAIASISADETGHFSVLLPLEAGQNSFVITQQSGSEVLRSNVITVTYTHPASGISQLGTTGGAVTKGTATMALGLAVIAAQWLLGIIGAIAAHGWLLVAILAASVISSWFAQGVVGLEIVAFLVRYFRHFARQTSGTRVRGLVVDAVTERPLAFVHVRIGGFQTITGLDGAFAAYLVPGGYDVDARRYHYAMVGTAQRIQVGELDAHVQIAMEPERHPSPRQRLQNGGLRLITWSLLLLGTGVVVRQFALTGGFGWLVLTMIWGVLLAANVYMLFGQHRIHWGQVVSPTGAPIADATIELLPAGRSEIIGRYRSDADGAYTLFAPPGEYTLRVNGKGGASTTETISIRRHAAYFGFRLQL